MTANYRRQLADNIKGLLTAKGIRSDRLQARYLAGAKKGKLVSARTIAYLIADRDDKYGANLDALAAIACSLGLQVYQLLLPDLDPFAPIPPDRGESYIEAEVERRLASALPRAIRNYRRQLQDEEHAQESSTTRPVQNPAANGQAAAARDYRSEAPQAKAVPPGRRKKTATATDPTG
jgi:hypothetical protein